MRFRPLAAVAACACLLVLPAIAGAEIKLTPTAGSPVTGTGTGGMLEATDFNGDGLEDLAIGNFTGGGDAVRIRLANADETWTSAPGLLPNANSSNIVAADFNDDEKQDLLITEFDPDNYPNGGDTYRVLLGNGDGTFQTPKTINTGGIVSTIVTGQTIVPTDLDGDGKLDLLFALWGNRVGAGLGNGDGTFDFSTSEIPAAPNGPQDGFTTLAIGDYNGDNARDFALGLIGGGDSPTVGNSGIIVIYGGSGNGRLSVSPLGAVTRMESGDFDRDGNDDLIVGVTPAATGKPMDVQVFSGSASGLSETSEPLFTLADANPNLVATDFDQDGAPDLAWIEEAASETAGFTSALVVAPGDSNGAFTRQDDFFDLGFAVNQSIAADLTTGDFNGDGSPDVAASFFSSDCNVQGCGTVVLGSRASIALDRNAVAFGTVNRGSVPESKSFEITNSGSAPAVVSSFAIAGTAPNRFPLEGQCNEIAPGASCTVTVDFDSSSAGEFSSTFIYGFDGLPGDFRVQASGTVVHYHGQFDLSSIPFGNIRVGDAPQTRKVTVTADGANGLTVGQLSIGGAGASQFTLGNDTCSGKTLASGTACSFDVSTAVTAAGPLAATVGFPSNGDDTLASLPVTATGLAPLTYRAALKLSGPKQVKAGQKIKLTAQTTNTGTGSLAGTVIKWKASQAGKPKASGSIKLATIAAGKKLSKTITVTITKRKLTRGKPVKITATLTRQNRSLSSSSISVRQK